ncbi:maleylpyruvate isomerase N-terminal domain-containing protein [Pedococcus soli]
MDVSDHRQAFLESVRISRDLAGSDLVRAAWGQESACAGMSVGGLAHHLLNQGVTVAKGLSSPAQGETIAVLEHYRRAPWVAASRAGQSDPEQNVRDDEAALAGPDAVLAGAAAHTDAVADLLARPRDPDTIFIPWQGWSLTTDDFLTTRMMEMLVHADDLAASVGTEAPTFPEGAVVPVVGLLAAVAADRHGATAVVRALSRPQRAPSSVSAF